MYVGIVKLSLVIAHSTSLKDKRMVIRRVKDRVRDRIGVAVSEVGSLDDRQRAELGCAVASADRQKALELIDQVVRIAQSASDGQVVTVARDAWTYDVSGDPLPAVDDRTGSGDKAVAAADAASGGDDDWIPDEWKDE